jgi:hypothetical protein
MKLRVVLITLVCFIILQDASAQGFYNLRNNRNFLASYGAGVTSYFGDLNNPKDYFDSKFSTNIGLQYLFAERFGVRSELTYFRLAGDDATAGVEGREIRNLSFRSDNIEFNVTGMVHLFPKGMRFYQRQNINPYAFAGIGLLYYNPRAELDGTWHNLRPIQTEGVAYSKFTVVIPMGIGVKVKAGPFFNVAAEVGLRTTFTDYLDDVSGTYIDNNSFESDLHRRLADRRWELGRNPAQEGAIRGNPNNNDSYMLINLKVEYFLPYALFGMDENDPRKIMQKRKRNRYRPRGR